MMEIRFLARAMIFISHQKDLIVCGQKTPIRDVSLLLIITHLTMLASNIVVRKVIILWSIHS